MLALAFNENGGFLWGECAVFSWNTEGVIIFEFSEKDLYLHHERTTQQQPNLYSFHF